MRYIVKVFLGMFFGYLVLFVVSPVFLNGLGGDDWLHRVESRHLVIALVGAAVTSLVVVGIMLLLLKKEGISRSDWQELDRVSARSEISTSLSSDEALRAVKSLFQGSVKQVSDNVIEIRNKRWGWWLTKTVLRFMSQPGGEHIGVQVAPRYTFFPIIFDVESAITIIKLRRLLKASGGEGKALSVQKTPFREKKRGGHVGQLSEPTLFLRYFAAFCLSVIPGSFILKFVSGYAWTDVAVARSFLSVFLFALLMSLTLIALSHFYRKAG